MSCSSEASQTLGLALNLSVIGNQAWVAGNPEVTSLVTRSLQ